MFVSKLTRGDGIHQLPFVAGSQAATRFTQQTISRVPVGT